MNNNQQSNSGGVKLGKGFNQAGSNQTGNQNYQQPIGQQNYQTNQYAQGGNYNAQQFQGNNYSGNQGNMYQGVPSNTAQPLQEANKKKPGKGLIITGVIIMVLFGINLINYICRGYYNTKTELIGLIITHVCFFAIGAAFVVFGYLKWKQIKDRNNMQN